MAETDLTVELQRCNIELEVNEEAYAIIRKHWGRILWPLVPTPETTSGQVMHYHNLTRLTTYLKQEGAEDITRSDTQLIS